MQASRSLRKFEDALGYSFTDKTRLIRELTHRSWSEDRYPGQPQAYDLCQERLEFLGDGLLSSNQKKAKRLACAAFLDELDAASARSTAGDVS